MSKQSIIQLKLNGENWLITHTEKNAYFPDNKTISNNSTIPSPLRAEIGTQITFPPQSSGTIFNLLDNSCFVFSIFAPSLSILLIATTKGILADSIILNASDIFCNELDVRINQFEIPTPDSILIGGKTMYLEKSN